MNCLVNKSKVSGLLHSRSFMVPDRGGGAVTPPTR